MSNPAPSAHAAVYNKLRNDYLLTAELPEKSGSVLTFGRATGTTLSPYVTVGHGGDTGDPVSEHLRTTIRVRIYYGAEQHSFVSIEKIIPLVKASLHNAELNIENVGFLLCLWSGYASGDLYDFVSRTWYRELRFTVYQGHHIA